MSRMLFARVVMSSEVEEEHIRGVEYSKDVSRFRPQDNYTALFKGDHGVHLLVWDESGKFHCSCRGFQRLQQLTDCRHIIATERILEKLDFPVQQTPMNRLGLLQLQRH